VKRCIFVTNSLTGGGAERAMNLLSNELHLRSWSILLVPINASRPDQIHVESEVISLNRKWKSGPLSVINATWKLNRVILSWKPEFIVLNCDLPELLGAFLLFRRKIIVVEHSSIPWKQRPQLGRFVRKLLEFRNANWVAVSNHLDIWPWGKAPNQILENAISFKSIPQSNYSIAEIRRLVFVGRLSHEKRPDFLIEIGINCNLSVLFIGDGPLRKNLEDKSDQLKLSSVFAGHVPSPWSLIEPGDLVVIPSETEGDGMVAVECIVMGIPVVMSSIPELLRFGLPGKHYSLGIDEFVLRIFTFKGKIQDLIAPSEIRHQLSISRSSRSIGDAWENYLKEL
jgi:glycosyltransferase involved in cell wall biosynthesis